MILHLTIPPVLINSVTVVTRHQRCSLSVSLVPKGLAHFGLRSALPSKNGRPVRDWTLPG